MQIRQNAIGWEFKKIQIFAQNTVFFGRFSRGSQYSAHFGPVWGRQPPEVTYACNAHVSCSCCSHLLVVGLLDAEHKIELADDE